MICNGNQSGSPLKFATTSREGGRPAPATPLLRVYFLGNYGWCCFECGVVAVMHCLRCSAFSLARLLSQLNHAETPSSPRDDHRSTSGCSPSHAMTYGYVYIAASSERISAYHTAFKLRRRAFDASANRRESFHPSSPSYCASQTQQSKSVDILSACMRGIR